jgi:solute carrier family 25 phosphate transporter 3
MVVEEHANVQISFYKVFKNIFSGMLSEENSYLYRTSLHLADCVVAQVKHDVAVDVVEEHAHVEIVPGKGTTRRNRS